MTAQRTAKPRKPWLPKDINFITDGRGWTVWLRNGFTLGARWESKPEARWFRMIAGHFTRIADYLEARREWERQREE